MLPEYICHKKVCAARIVHICDDGVLVVDPADGRDEICYPLGLEWCANKKPEAGGYLVVYEDGYVSFSPKKAFESGYKRK